MILSSFFTPLFELDNPFLFVSFVDLPAHIVIAMTIPPDENVFSGELVEQITHLDILQLLPLRDVFCVQLDAEDHKADEQADGGIDDEGSNEEAVLGYKWIIRRVVVAG